MRSGGPVATGAHASGKQEARGQANRKEQGRVAQSQPTFTVSDFAHSSRLSRTTIKYYEKVGILSPDDFDETTHRYSERGARRLSCAIALRNIGIPIGEIANKLDREPFSPDALETYEDLISRRILRDEAMLVCLSRQSKLIEASGTVRLERVGVYLIQMTPTGESRENGTDAAGTGASQQPKDDLGYPISNYGGLFCGDDPFAPTSLVHGRSVAREHLGAVEGFGEDDLRVGGSRCLVARVLLPQYSFEQLDWEELFAPIRAKAQSLHVKAAGRAFVPYCAPMLSGDVYLPICVPVRHRGLLGS